MKRVRVIPVLLVDNYSLYKTVKFKAPNYIGDPVNAIKIFNEKEVDEIVVLGINCPRQNVKPNFQLIEELAGECFMPLAYGGGIRTMEDVQLLLKLGVEKIILNSLAFTDRDLLRKLTNKYGSSTIVGSVDYKKRFLGGNIVYIQAGTKSTGLSPLDAAKQLEQDGVGEIILNCIDRDGVRNGYDLQTIQEISAAVSVPIVVCGGANTISDFKNAVVDAKASAVAAGSMFVYMGNQNSILINYPDQQKLKEGLFKYLN